MKKPNLRAILINLLAWPAPYGTLDTTTGRAILNRAVAEGDQAGNQARGKGWPVNQQPARRRLPPRRAILGLR